MNDEWFILGSAMMGDEDHEGLGTSAIALWLDLNTAMMGGLMQGAPGCSNMIL
jgi:hypothetical protein